MSVDLTFFTTRKKFNAFNHENRKFAGTYKQSGKGKRKVTFKFDRKSTAKIKRDIKLALRNCFGFKSVSIDFKKTKVTGSINRAKDAITLKGTFKVEGKADGESGEAKYTFKTTGPLTLTR